jgi:hypothetical protein
LSDRTADVELVAGIVSGHLTGNGKGPRDVAMTELLKMPCETSHDIFEKLYRRSIPCLYHASQAPGVAPLLLVLSHLLWEMRAASLAYIA